MREQAASRGLCGSESITEWRDRGFMFGKQPHVLDALLNDASYYGNAFHHPSYMRSRWSQWFDVLEIIPAQSATPRISSCCEGRQAAFG